MSERTAGIDPRFDARYQRGYPGDRAETDWEPAAASVPEPVRLEPPRAAPEADPADLIRALVAERDAADPRSAVEESTPALDPLDAEPEVVRARRVPKGRLWIGLLASVAMAFIGLALVWNAATDRSVYTGTASGSEGDAIRFLGTVAPGFIQAGSLGCVVVLVVWAILARSAAALEAER